MDALRQAVAAGFRNLDRDRRRFRLRSPFTRTGRLQGADCRSSRQGDRAAVGRGDEARPGCEWRHAPAAPAAAAPVRSRRPRRIRRPPSTRSAWSCSTSAGSTPPPSTWSRRSPCVSGSSRTEPESLAYQMDLAATLMGLARLDQKAGRPEQARQSWGQAAPFLTRAVEQRPDDRQAWKDLGIVRAELGQAEAAATAFARLMELTPESHRAAILIDLATLDQKAGRLEQARQMVGEGAVDPGPGRRATTRTTVRPGKTWASPTPSWASRRLPPRPSPRSWS